MSACGDRGGSPEAADNLVSGLYRAAAGELPWGEPLAAMRTLFGAWGVHLHGIRTATGTVAFSYEVGGFPAEGVLAYIRHYHRIDPRAAHAMRLAVGEWMSCHHHFDDAFVARDPFYQEFLIPYGGRYMSGGRIYEDAEIVVFIGIHRGRGMLPLTAQELAIGQRLGHHVTTALGLWRRQGRLLKEHLLGNAVLEQLAHPVMLIDEQQRLHHANASALRLLAAHEHLRLQEGALALPTRQAQHDLLVTLRRLRIGGERSYRQDAAPASRAVVRIGDGQRRLALLVSALHPENTMGAFGDRDLAMVVVHEPGRRAAVDRFLAAAIFDLTPAEAAVAVAVAQGCRLRDIATEHGVAVSTVRAQLSVVFAKMGVKRQAEVASALASLPAAGWPRVGGLPR